MSIMVAVGFPNIVWTVVKQMNLISLVSFKARRSRFTNRTLDSKKVGSFNRIETQSTFNINSLG